MAEGMVTMSQRERERMRWLERVKRGDLTLAEAAGFMRLSYRQARRLARRYREQGSAGLVHASRGRPGWRAKPSWMREEALDCVERFYTDHGPTLAAEKLEEHHGIQVDHETLRRWMGGPIRQEWRRAGRKHRSRRPRRKRFGELIQMDGSHHRWLEERGPECCLMVMIDDATGRRMGWFSAGETTEGAMRLMGMWMERHGVPQALYVDGKNTFITRREPTEEEIQRGEEPLTALGRACRKLGIEVIHAHSPQAKGRVERANRVFQDRLVKDLRLAGIQTIEAANAFLADGWMEKHSGQFEKPAADPGDAHRPVADYDPGAILAWEEERVVGRDAAVRYENRWFQLGSEARPGMKVTVRRRLDGKLEILKGERVLEWSEVTEPVPRSGPPAVPTRPRKAWHPAPDHPWRNAGILKMKPADPDLGKTKVSAPGAVEFIAWRLSENGKNQADDGEREKGRTLPDPASHPTPPRRSGRSPAEPYPPGG